VSMLRTLLAHNPSPMTGEGTRTFLIGERRPAVVDPGPDDPAHREAVLGALGGHTPVAILLTHAHPDHAEGARTLAERTGAPVRMLPGALVDLRVDDRLADGERIPTDAGELQVVATPGHAPEHACFLWTGAPEAHERACFVGDHFLGGADTTLVAPPEGNLTDYLASLDRLEVLAPSILYPAHGPPIGDAIAAIGRYRAHRADRISQVVQALRQGPARPAELVRRVYGAALDPALAAAAEGSLHAILAHLRDSGTVLPAGDGRHRLAEPERR
jgi:glyoxylase-like metal-dependent hydrolase (beta-lactamase superfamily II)